MTERRLRLAVLLSGGGRSFENLVLRSRAGDLPADVVLVVSSTHRAGGLERAARLGVPAVTVEAAVPRGASPDERARAARTVTGRVLAACDEAGADLACLAGWLKLLAPIPPAWKGRLVNVHPALLPAFGGPGMYGERVHQAVLDAGCKVTGCTIHVCDDLYDHGPIVLQRTCPVLEDDDVHALASRVFEEEKLAWVEALRLFHAGRVRVEGRRARVLPPP